MSDPAKKLMERLQSLGRITDEPGRLTRTFCSPAMRRANQLVGGWMREAGTAVRQDAVGNLIGRYPGARRNSKTLLLGSHLDTVRNAGKYDGPLGVLLAIACVESLHHRKIRLPFALEIIGFADEEGVRYQTAYLGSRAVTGRFNPADLRRTDATGTRMGEAIRLFGGDPARLKQAKLDGRQLLGYLEAHIEQGPILEQKRCAVGVVTAIAGQSRLRFSFSGKAGHAGTTPMRLRKDALCGAAEFILAVEKVARATRGLVATVGQARIEPGASNVIPGMVEVTVDVRHQEDTLRQAAVRKIYGAAQKAAARRFLKFSGAVVQETASVPCSPSLSHVLRRAVRRFQKRVVALPSGAGHDAAVMAAVTPISMLFIRCKEGLSHHPGESVDIRDVRMALDVMNEFLEQLAGHWAAAPVPAPRLYGRTI